MTVAQTARLVASLELQDKFTGTARSAEGALGRLEGGFGRLGAGMGQVGRGLGQVGSGLDRIVTRGAVAAVGLGTAFVTTAASMQEAFTGVEKTVEATDAEFQALRQSLRELSSETGTSFEELSRIGETAGALGVPIGSMEEFIDVVNRLGVSTDLSTDQAATALGQLGTILHLEGEEYRAFADTLVALGNAGASTEPQIIDLAARFAAAGNRAGLTTDEILALSSAVTSMGVEVEAGGTALSQTFNEIALAIGTGGDEVEGFTRVLGISAEEFRRRWETDALGTFQEFLQEISKLDPIAQAVALDMAGITGARQLSAVGLMADNWQFVAEQVGVAEGATGDLGKESDKFFGTAAAGFRRVKESVRLAADTVGEQLLPQIGELSEEFVDFLQDPAQQAAIKQFGTDLAGGVRDFVAEIRKADFGPLIGTLQGAASIAKGAFDAFRSLPAPIQQLALAAIVANKVTGGAVGGIAAGLGNLIVGGLKIAFLDRGTATNPMWVRSIGAIGSGPTGPNGPTTGGGLGWLGRALAVATGAAIGYEIAGPEFERQLGGGRDFMASQRDSLLTSGSPAQLRAALLGLDETIGELRDGIDPEALAYTFDIGGLKTEIQATREAIVARLAAIEAGERPSMGPPLPAGFSGFGVGALQAEIARIKSLTTLPDTAVLNKDSFAAVLPDTAMTPVTSELGRVKSEVASQGSRQLAKQDAIAAAVRGQIGVLAQIRDRKQSVTVQNTNIVNVTMSEIQRRFTSQSIALGITPTTPELR